MVSLMASDDVTTDIVSERRLSMARSCHWLRCIITAMKKLVSTKAVIGRGSRPPSRLHARRSFGRPGFKSCSMNKGPSNVGPYGSVASISAIAAQLIAQAEIH